MNQEYSLSLLCRVLEASKSGYYRWLEREQGVRAQANARLDQRIVEAFAENRRAYGSPRLTVELRAAGCPCSENRVARRMRRRGQTFLLDTFSFKHQTCAPAFNALEADQHFI